MCIYQNRLLNETSDVDNSQVEEVLVVWLVVALVVVVGGHSCSSARRNERIKNVNAPNNWWDVRWQMQSSRDEQRERCDVMEKQKDVTTWNTTHEKTPCHES